MEGPISAPPAVALEALLHAVLLPAALLSAAADGAAARLLPAALPAGAVPAPSDVTSEHRHAAKAEAWGWAKASVSKYPPTLSTLSD